LSQKRNFFAEFLGENIWKIITSVPDHRVHVVVPWKCRRATEVNFSQRLYLGPILQYDSHKSSTTTVKFFLVQKSATWTTCCSESFYIENMAISV
jgi:hypothetical protein